MKVATWNCNMAFRNKAEFILQYTPDILVIQECEHPDKLKFKAGVPVPTDMLWFGSNLNKGLGIFSYGEFRLSGLTTYNTNLKMIVPVLATCPRFQFTLFAVWANNPGDADGRYVEQVWKAVKHYDGMLTDTATILIGDFNSNSVWDKEHRNGSHSTVVGLLKNKGIQSAYHFHYAQKQGKEKHPTLYLYRHADKPYHLDYCFLSSHFLRELKSVEVGDHAYWSAYSDHVPIIVTINDDNLQTPS